jgi:Asp-tRNA(Asn)/Glu-tRNA(Gln) amidotransferase B subunit
MRKLTKLDVERSRAALSRENRLRNEFQETLQLLYVAMLTAFGGGDLLDESNAILLNTIKNGLITNRAVRDAIFQLVSSTTSPDRAMSECGFAAIEGADIKH